METYDENLPVRLLLPELFRRFNIPQNAYTSKTFVIKVGPLPLHFPNSRSRVKVARFHDLHHLLTGYPANWVGEAEIGAWEIATGCRQYFIAWFLNFGAMIVGLFLQPGKVIRAFERGRKTKKNLYYDFDYEELLEKRLPEIRTMIGLPN